MFVVSFRDCLTVNLMKKEFLLSEGEYTVTRV